MKTAEKKRRKGEKGIRRPQWPKLTSCIRAGQFRLWQSATGKYWVTNPAREGLVTSEAKIEEMLAKFCSREF